MRLVGGVSGDERRFVRASGGGEREFRADADRGSFTAELAAGLPALLLLLLAGLTAVNAVSTRASCLHAAREAALAAARDEADNSGGGYAAPSGAEVSVSIDGGRAQATVRAPVRALGGRLPRITVVATAVAALEPRGGEGMP
ncbi:TadE family type IV pilus minor pilin [Micromonospora sp. NPDC053740]|uniref:TadE family type IV pilus minor pilin n=1 Tax=Micromonospora TaxID=1873 RepID=UPI00237972CA|nr:TadE family type IV pilus minor pilin [Micromonospora alfalfae]